MTDIALIPVHELRANLVLTDSLAWWVCAIEDGADLPETLPSDVMAEAQRQSLLADRLMTPVPPAVLRPWLARIAANYTVLHGKYMSPEDSGLWREGIEIATEGMPAGVFTRGNIAEIFILYDWLPSPGQIMKVLIPDRDNLERRANALRRVAQQGKDRQ